MFAADRGSFDIALLHPIHTFLSLYLSDLVTRGPPPFWFAAHHLSLRGLTACIETERDPPLSGVAGP